MKQQGSLIKKLRTDRKISQAKLAEGISSRTTLSSFENRKTNLSSQTLFDYLDKMNITVHEFSLLIDSEATGQKRQLVQDFYTRYYDRTLTIDYLTSLEERYFETQNFFYYSLYVQGLLLLNRESFLMNRGAYTQEVELVKQYLFDIETWGRFELN
jgi:transcriptional regulator with XRE-family HTH domain